MKVILELKEILKAHVKAQIKWLEADVNHLNWTNNHDEDKNSSFKKEVIIEKIDVWTKILHNIDTL